MARLIDADALLALYKKWLPQLTQPEDAGDRNGVETCIAVLEEAPTIYAVPVVRCKDCKHAIVNEKHIDKPLICCLTKMVGTTDEDWFCADGERRMDGGASK